MFKIPEQYRVRKGNLASDGSFGNNGMFVIPAGQEAIPDQSGKLTKVPYFIFVVASDQQSWEHISIVIHTIGPQRAPVKEEVDAIRNMFWGKDDQVFQYMPSSRFKDENPLCIQLWRKPGVEMPVPPLELSGLQKKSEILTIAKKIITGQVDFS